MKKVLSIVLVVAMAACAFAGTWSVSGKLGYDQMNYKFRAKGLKFNIETDDFLGYDIDFSDKDLRKFENDAYDGAEFLPMFLKNASIVVAGPSVTVEGAAKVAKNWSVYLNASYIFPTDITVNATKLLGDIDDFLELDNDVNPENANIKNVSISVTKHQVNKFLNGMEAAENDDDFTLKMNFSMNGLKAGTGAAYTLNLGDVEFVAKAGLKFDATFLGFKEKAIDYDVEPGEDAEVIVDKINATLLSFGAAAEADVRINCGKHLAVEFGAGCDCGLFNILNAKVTQANNNKKMELGKAHVFSFAVAPAFNAKAGVVVKF